GRWRRRLLGCRLLGRGGRRRLRGRRLGRRCLLGRRLAGRSGRGRRLGLLGGGGRLGGRLLGRGFRHQHRVLRRVLGSVDATCRGALHQRLQRRPSRRGALSSGGRRSMAAGASSGSRPPSRTRLVRLDSPPTRVTSASFRPSSLARKATRVALARPSTGGAATFTLTASPYRPVTADRPPPGWAWTRSTTAPSTTS